MRNPVFLCVIAALPIAVAACGGGDDASTSTSTSTSSSSTSTSDSTSASSGAGGAGSTSTTSSGSGGTPLMPSPGADKIVINEMNAIGTNEWVEIVNTYDKAVNLQGYALADSAMAGGPDASHALRFPAGASIDAGAYLLVVRNDAAKNEDVPVKHIGTDCVADALASSVCYYTTWEISNKTGEFIYFLAQDDQVLAAAEYTANAVDAAAGYKSWARIPDKTGNFAASKQDTPGFANLP